MPWKRWVKNHYGLSLTRESIRNLAQKCRSRYKIPPELTQKIRALTVYTHRHRTATIMEMQVKAVANLYELFLAAETMYRNVDRLRVARYGSTTRRSTCASYDRDQITAAT
jgi:hypothetical protein